MTTIDLAISADCHVGEPLDLWTTRLPNALRKRGPRLEPRDGRPCFVVEDRIVRSLPRSTGSGGRTAEAAAQGASWGHSDPADRLRALAADGVWAEVLYPNLGFFCAFAIEDPGLQVETCRVYNDWIAEQFADTPRCAPVGMLPVLDVAACGRELERFESLGLRAGLLPAHSDAKPYNDPSFEPLWERAAGLGIPLSFHAGTGRSQTPARGPGGAIVNYVVTVSGPMETMSYLCGSGVLERHPDLRVAMVECGAGWLAWTLDAMDDAYREHHMFVKPKLRELPSVYFRRQGAVTFQRDEVGIANRVHTGTDCLMWGSDYPHPEGTYPDSRKVLEQQFAGVAPEAVERIVCRNAAELYRIPLPQRAGAAGGRRDA